MARFKRKRGGSRKAKSIAVAPIIPGAVVAIRAAQQSGSIGAKMNYASIHLTGFNMDTGKFVPQEALPFWAGTIAGVVVHKAATKTGVNNYMRKLTFGYLSL